MREMVVPPVRKMMPTARLISATTVCAFQPGLLVPFSVVKVDSLCLLELFGGWRLWRSCRRRR